MFWVTGAVFAGAVLSVCVVMWGILHAINSNKNALAEPSRRAGRPSPPSAPANAALPVRREGEHETGGPSVGRGGTPTTAPTG